MHTRHSDALKAVENQFADFAKTHILVRPGLGRQNDFPEDIWKEMGKACLFNQDLFNFDQCGPDYPGAQNPNRSGAPGFLPSGCRAVAKAARNLVEHGGNLGIALSWMIQVLVGRYLVFPQCKKNRDKADPIHGLLEKMKTGNTRVAFAVSEPNAGAHPKHMTASALKEGNTYILNGEKAYLTNGPLAQYFLVVALTGQDRGKKLFSTFLVPKDSPGLTCLPPMELSFFRPCPHGSISLCGCRVGAESLIGREGQAFPEMVLPFRGVEDAAMTGAVTGAMAFILKAAAGQMAEKKEVPKDDLAFLGRLFALVETAGILSEQITAIIDSGGRGPKDSGALVLGFRQMAGQFQTRMENLMDRCELILPDPAGVLFQDLVSSASLGRTTNKIREMKLGQKLFEK